MQALAGPWRDWSGEGRSPAGRAPEFPFWPVRKRWRSRVSEHAESRLDSGRKGPAETVLGSAAAILELPALVEAARGESGLSLDLVVEGGNVGAKGPLQVSVAGLCLDSRVLQPGDVYFALRGRTFDGLAFCKGAAAAGAVALVVPASVGASGFGVPVVLAEDPRKAMAHMAAAYYGAPSKRLNVVGITGTDGKSSTAWILRQVLEASGRKAAGLGTLGILLEGNGLLPWPAPGRSGSEGLVLRDGHWQRADDRYLWHATSPEAPIFQWVLKSLQMEGYEIVVAEVSSHALTQDRILGTHFEVVVLTHVASDHLDFHVDQASYEAAKARLFDPLARTGPRGKPAKAVLNIDDPFGRRMASSTKDRVLGFGRRAGAWVRLSSERRSGSGLDLLFEEKETRVGVHLPLLGSFQASNALTAVATARALGCEWEAIRRGLENLMPVPGRFEPIDAGQPFTVIVDYAHTPDGLQKVCDAAVGLKPRRFILIFGCGGDRDPSKRQPMGRIAGQYADLCIVTTDNPRSEDPEAIAHQVAAGVKQAGGEPIVEIDRRRAIQRALDAAESGDLVLIAGRGAERWQVLDSELVEFDDRVVARELLAALGYSAPQARRGGDA